jgi:hypothetical protein
LHRYQKSIEDMDLQLEGVVKELLPLQEGEGRNGPWKKQQFILETQSGQYPRHVCIVVWGDRIDQYRLQTGDQVIASIDIESREFNGRWYTDVKAWRVERKKLESVPSTEGPPQQENLPEDDPFGGTVTADPFAAKEEDDDLPF